jgi:hypothetical protein
VIDPGETVTVNLTLRNYGVSNAVNVTATLLATNGVTGPSAPQNYGTLNNNGNTTTRSFSFVANGACGSVISPTLRLESGGVNLGTASFNFTLGTPATTFTQRFDTVAAPALPAGWTNTASGSTTGWRTTSASSHTAPNSVFAPNATAVSDAWLTSPAIPISSPTAQLAFRHRYVTEDSFDGGVLEIQINNGSFIDILAAGGNFASGGYDFVISDEWESPIANREAWTGDSGGFVSTVVNLPPSAAGQNVRLRWRFATDVSFGEIGWYVDTISISEGYSCCRTLIAPQLVDTWNVNNNVVFSFNILPGQTYVTEYQTVLSTGLVWTALQTNVGDGTRKSITNAAGAAAQRFLRIKTQNTP